MIISFFLSVHDFINGTSSPPVEVAVTNSKEEADGQVAEWACGHWLLSGDSSHELDEASETNTVSEGIGVFMVVTHI
mgnify:CR=1 FL=1